MKFLRQFTSSAQFRLFFAPRTGLFALALATAACTHVPFDTDRSQTTAFDIAPDSGMMDTAQEISRAKGGKSAFVPLVSGTDALGARLRLIEAAEQTIDVQYFLLKPDLSGGLFARALIDAAERGVRVRFVLDDVFTTASDRQLALLNSHENIELRLFNPLSRNAPKAMNFLLDYPRVNRRMHNKSLIVDNAMAIIGGRNIADEYFQINTDTEFADLDLFTAGPVAQEIAKTFDLFWNDSRAVPMAVFAPANTSIQHQDANTELQARVAQAGQDVYRDAINSPFLDSISNGTTQLTYAHASVVTDLPAKLDQPPKSAPQHLADTLKDQMRQAEEEILLITPYFVPRADDVAMFKAFRAQGKRVRILTNSLASTNHSYVHGGYAQHREELLLAGVELFEIRADSLQAIGVLPPESDVILTLHTKAAVFDRETIFVGSLNFDPRSIEINSELGIFVSNATLAGQFSQSVDTYIAQHAYQVSLDTQGQLTWAFNGVVSPQIKRSEPEAGFFRHLIADLARLLPVKGQL
jgi:putative cardiolipin synthase